MLKFGIVVEFEVQLKGKIEKMKLFLLQNLNKGVKFIGLINII